MLNKIIKFSTSEKKVIKKSKFKMVRFSMYSGECLDDEDLSGSAYFDETDSNNGKSNLGRTTNSNSNNFGRMDLNNGQSNTLRSVQHLQMTPRHMDPTHAMRLGKILISQIKIKLDGRHSHPFPTLI